MFKRGSTEWQRIFTIIIVFAVVILLLYIFNYVSGGSVTSFFKNMTFQEENFSISGSNLVSYSKIINERAGFLDYFIGQVPDYLIKQTGGIDGNGRYSAAIIMICIWLFLFLAFEDIVSTFGTFTKTVSFIVAFVLVVIGSNLKITIYLAVVASKFAALVGFYSIIASLLVIFGIFVLAHLGFDWFKALRDNRKKAEMEMKAMIRGAKVSAGIKTAEDLGEEAARK